MNNALADRANYRGEYTYFIPTAGTDWRIETLGTHTTFDENGQPQGTTPFSVALFSEQDSSEVLQAVLDNHAVLTVNATGTQLTANGLDSVAWSIVGQTAFTYVLYRDNLQVATGNVNDGTLVFATDEPGVYHVELKTGNQTGYATAEAI